MTSSRKGDESQKRWLAPSPSNEVEALFDTYCSVAELIRIKHGMEMRDVIKSQSESCKVVSELVVLAGQGNAQFAQRVEFTIQPDRMDALTSENSGWLDISRNIKGRSISP